LKGEKKKEKGGENKELNYTREGSRGEFGFLRSQKEQIFGEKKNLLGGLT